MNDKIYDRWDVLLIAVQFLCAGVALGMWLAL